MKNRDWIRNQSQYDLLCKMQQNIEDAADNEKEFCIMVALGEPIRCHRFDSCQECIASYLNEEVR